MQSRNRTPTGRSGLRPICCLVILLTASACYQPQRVPPPGAIPYNPADQAADLFTPRNGSLPPLSRPPVGSALADTFPWLPAAPMHRWRYIVLHHTASDSGSVDSINDAHQQRTDSEGNPWRGIGYHFVIGNGNGMPDGAIEPTFRWEDQSAGAHAGIGEYNEFGIGVCLVGNFEEQPPSPAQLQAVKRLVSALKAELNIDSSRVVKHGDLKATACPGRLFPHDEVAQTPPAFNLSSRWVPAW